MSQRKKPKQTLQHQPSNVVAHGAERDITQEVPEPVLMSYADMCIKLPVSHLDALVLTAMHAKAFKLGITDFQTIQMSFDPKDGPYIRDSEDVPDTRIIKPGHA